MRMQKAMIEKQMRRGGADPWAVDFNPELSGKDLTDPTEVMKDPAQQLGATKAFSF